MLPEVVPESLEWELVGVVMVVSVAEEMVERWDELVEAVLVLVGSSLLD